VPHTKRASECFLLLPSYHNCAVVVVVAVVLVVAGGGVVVFGIAKYECLLSSLLCYYLTISFTKE